MNLPAAPEPRASRAGRDDAADPGADRKPGADLPAEGTDRGRRAVASGEGGSATAKREDGGSEHGPRTGDVAASSGNREPGPDGERRVRPPTPRAAVVIAGAVVLGLLLYLGREALAPFVVGALLVYLLDPPVERLSRAGVPRWAAVLVVYVVVGFAAVQAVSITIRPLVDQIRRFVADLPALVGQVAAFYEALQLPPAIRQTVEGWIAGASGGGAIDPTIVLPVVNLTAGFISALFGYLIIPVWGFYLLKDRPRLAAAFDRTLPQEWRADVHKVGRLIGRVFGQWVRGQLFLGTVVGVATFIGLQVLNVAVDPVFGRFALLLAVLAGILELLPVIGPIIAAVPAVLLALTAGPHAAIAAIGLYVLVQQVENNVLVPKIQGDAVELHPSAVMFSLVVGGAIAGLLGAILALPITAAGRDVFRYVFRRVSGLAPDEAAVPFEMRRGSSAETAASRAPSEAASRA